VTVPRWSPIAMSRSSALTATANNGQPSPRTTPSAGGLRWSTPLWSDRDELAAGDEDRTAVRERSEGEEDRRGIVVDGERVLRREELARRAAHVILPRPAASATGVVLERRVSRDDAQDGLARGLGQRRAAEVRVQENARRVDGAHERGREAARERVARRGQERLRFRAAGSDRVAQLLLDGLPAVEGERLGRLGPGEEGVHRRRADGAHGRYYRKR